MGRSSWKCDMVNLENSQKFKNKKILINQRNFLITPEFLNKKISIYNGKIYLNVFISKHKLGYKFGEFSFTRRKPIHKKKK